MISSLNPIFYRKISINKQQLKSKSIQFTSLIEKFDIFNTTWEEYRKTPYNRELNDLEICKKYGCRLKKISIVEARNFILEISNVENYMRQYLLYNLHKTGKKYDYVCLVRTDTIWYDEHKTYKESLSQDTPVFRGLNPSKAPSLSNLDFKQAIIDYNKNITKIQFTKFINDIKMVIQNNEDAITYYSKSEELNTMLPIEQFGFYRYNNIVPSNIILLSETFDIFRGLYLEELLEKLYSRYPIMDVGAWWGEQSQKRRHILFKNNISEDIQFKKYFRILRN
jgi:hypothetical protein